jgi:hypothetical protein
MISFVTSDLDPSVLLAIAHRIVKAGGRSVFEWNDTVRWRAVEVQRVDAHTEERIEFTSVGGARYTFIPLTLALYVQHVQPTVVGQPSFSSIQALWDFYEGRGRRPFGWEYEPRRSMSPGTR